MNKLSNRDKRDFIKPLSAGSAIENPTTKLPSKSNQVAHPLFNQQPSKSATQNNFSRFSF